MRHFPPIRLRSLTSASQRKHRISAAPSFPGERVQVSVKGKSFSATAARRLVFWVSCRFSSPASGGAVTSEVKRRGAGRQGRGRIVRRQRVKTFRGFVRRFSRLSSSASASRHTASPMPSAWALKGRENTRLRMPPSPSGT